ncbi:MAG: hypothetical protein ACRC62_32640 [Microcoleus sp.]
MTYFPVASVQSTVKVAKYRDAIGFAAYCARGVASPCCTQKELIHERSLSILSLFRAMRELQAIKCDRLSQDDKDRFGWIVTRATELVDEFKSQYFEGSEDLNMAVIGNVNSCLDKGDSRYLIQGFKVGDLVTENFYTDSRAGRVIEVLRKGREVVFQEDFSRLSKSFTPHFAIGGFMGHCTNQGQQSYTYESNPNGRISVHTLRTWRGIKIWTRKGDTPNGKNSISLGQYY